VRVGSSAFTAASAAARVSRNRFVSSVPAACFWGRSIIPSNIPVDHDPVPVPFFPQFPVSARRSIVDRTMRSLW
jgi:hypothetical protein